MGKHKKKQQAKQAKQRREQKRGQRKARKPEPRGPGSGSEGARGVARLPPLDPLEPQRCLPAITIDATGKVVRDPHAELGVSRGADEQVILSAWRARIVEHPPERDPEGARRLLEARERLLDPARVIERELGTLHVPDPQEFGLMGQQRSGEMLTARERLVGQLALYALLEVTERELEGAQLTIPV